MRQKDMPFLEEIVFGAGGADPTAEAVLRCTFDTGVLFSAEDADGAAIDSFQIKGEHLLQALRMFGEGKARVYYGESIAVTTTLDPSQCRAVLAALTQRVSIIQGPPGPVTPPDFWIYGGGFAVLPTPCNQQTMTDPAPSASTTQTRL